MNEEIRIEAGIPIPGFNKTTKTGSGSVSDAEIIKSMNAFDSFAVNFESKEQYHRVCARWHAAARRAGGIKMVVRTVEENGKKLIRVWRRS